jgi:LemA protein
MKRLGLLVLVALLAIVALGAGCSYNRFITSEEAVKAQWGQVENQLQRRYDLIPNLVETARGYAAHEKEVFQAVADARARLSGATQPVERVEAANQMESALARLLVVVENYPQLKADAQFARLMDELAGTENRLSAERLRYNDRVNDYRTLRRRFPSNLTAALFGFDDYPYFEAVSEAKAAPKVDFGKGR